MICDECGLGDEELPNLVEDCVVDVCPHVKARGVSTCERCGLELGVVGSDALTCVRADCPQEPERPALDSLKRSDPINPSHYRQGGLEAIDVIEAFGLGFCVGNALKYILRYRFKHDPLEDLKKARWYLDRRISQLEMEE